MPTAIVDDLVDLGVDKAHAQKVVGRVVELLGTKTEEAVRAEGRADARGSAIWGGACLVLGLAITLGSASAASSGGYYVVTYGLIIGGAVMLVRGLIRMR